MPPHFALLIRTDKDGRYHVGATSPCPDHRTVAVKCQQSSASVKALNARSSAVRLPKIGPVQFRVTRPLRDANAVLFAAPKH